MGEFDGNNAAASLVSRILAELRENPEAKRLLFNELLNEEMRQMPKRVEKIERNVEKIERNVEKIERNVEKIKADVAETKKDVAETKKDIKDLKDDMGFLKGDNLEFKLGVRLRFYASQWLQLRGVVVLSSYVEFLIPELDQAVDKAEQEGLITPRQKNRIAETDVILRAKRRADGSSVCVPAEASHTIDPHDIDRVKESAEALQIVMGMPVIPLAAGYAVSDKTRQYAEELGVEVRLLLGKRRRV